MKFDLSWPRLVRLPNTPTVIADVLAGFVLAAGAWTPALPLALAILAIVALYWAGMVFNDVADIEQDTIERPKRPIPSGAVLYSTAQRGAITFLIMGITLAIATDLTYHSKGSASPWNYGTAISAVALSVFILLYDVVAKKTWAGPWLMGSCRACSLLLGCAAGGLALDQFSTHIPRAAMVVAAIGHGVYVAGFTLAGRKEAAVSSRHDLINGWTIAIAGVFILGSVDYSAQYFGIDQSHRRYTTMWIYPVIIAALALPLVRNIIKTLQTRAGRDIQAAIKQAIVTIIFFDAALALQYGSTTQALVICALVFPMLLLGKWLYST